MRHIEADGQLREKLKKSGAKGSVAFLKESLQLGCVSHDAGSPKKSLQLKNLDQIAPSHFPRAHGTIIIQERKSPSKGVMNISELQERNS